MSTKALFSPIKVGNNNLKHRVVLAPVTRFRATKEAVPTDLMREYYEQRSSDGGLLITEATFIDPLAGSYPKAPGVYNKEQIEGWKKVTDAVHKKNATFFLQLWHVGRAGSKTLNPNGEQVVSASDVPIKGKNPLANDLDYEVPHPLEIDEIKAIVKQYAEAAKNSIEAGFDGVEIHAANGYLVDQFINTCSNKRTDIYGGSLENRARFALEVLDAVVDAVGVERTAIRFSPGGEFQDMHDDNVEETWGYLTTKIQEKYPNLAYMHFVEARGDFLSGEKFTYFEDTLGPYRKIWKGPFITSSGFTNAVDYAFDIAEKTGDLISFGRAFIANPDLPERLRNHYKLNPYDRSTFYSEGSHGYTDYPFYDQSKEE